MDEDSAVDRAHEIVESYGFEPLPASTGIVDVVRGVIPPDSIPYEYDPVFDEVNVLHPSKGLVGRILGRGETEEDLADRLASGLVHSWVHDEIAGYPEPELRESAGILRDGHQRYTEIGDSIGLEPVMMNLDFTGIPHIRSVKDLNTPELGSYYLGAADEQELERLQQEYRAKGSDRGGLDDTAGIRMEFEDEIRENAAGYRERIEELLEPVRERYQSVREVDHGIGEAAGHLFYFHREHPTRKSLQGITGEEAASYFPRWMMEDREYRETVDSYIRNPGKAEVKNAIHSLLLASIEDAERYISTPDIDRDAWTRR